MPFTISHVAAALPFLRHLSRLRVLSAVVIGSMVPDFGMFLPWRPQRIETHSIIGLYAFCLPVGLACWWLFQRLIKPAMLELLPDPAYVQSRDRSVDLGKMSQWVAAVAGVFFGALTHLIWDGFTHEGARGVRMIPALDDPVVDFAGHQLLGFKLMQLASSVIGLALVIWVLWRVLHQAAVAPAPTRRLGPAERHGWVAGYTATALVATAVFFVHAHWRALASHAMTATANSIAIAGLRGLALALIGVSACLAIRLKMDG
jgi:hypothetical protein